MEITTNNFSENFENIRQSLNSSCFVSFDAEFIGLLSSECFKHRLFDTNEERYERLKTEVKKMIMTQVGLTMFHYKRSRDTYEAVTYTFHLSPQQIADIDQSFVCQASNFDFLCRHNFDFNKFIYEGVPFLSKYEEKKIRDALKDKSLVNNALCIDDEKLLQSYCSEVSKWLIQSKEDTMYIDLKDPKLRFILHNQLRICFPNILTTDSLGNSDMILLYRNKDVDGATHASDCVLEEKLMNHILGFSKVIALLQIYKKPIIGHNLFLDLVLLHHQFIGPMPKKYSVFKKNLLELFPEMYDTKYISYEMRRKLTLDECWPSNGLQDLYEFFHEGKCKKLEVAKNRIVPMTQFKDTQSYHEAGWDSYVTGYCFLRLGHWAASENRGTPRPISPVENLAVLSGYRNKVNVIRASVPYMNLEGHDPPSSRPKLMYIRSLNGNLINIGQVATLLAGYGSIDVKRYGAKGALVAANTQSTVDKILKQFKNSCDYRVVTYNVFRHSLAGRMAVWSSAVISGGLMLFFLHRNVKS